MSRISLIERIYRDSARGKRKSAFEFDYDALAAPLIRWIFSQDDINELISIATSIRYNANITKKYEMIDKVMRRRGFVKAHAGTNRVVYNFLEDPGFVAKVAVDAVGMKDSPREYHNQQYFKPFCCKIFEVDPSGVIAFVERVRPISSLEEFISVSDSIFNLMITKIVGKYVVDDLGTKTYMNFGIRDNSMGCAFGPVIIDFPYVYELDGAKLICHNKLVDNCTEEVVDCGGDIDYDAGFNYLYCTKCGKRYTAMDLAKPNKTVEFYYDNGDKQIISDISHCFRARVLDRGKVLYDSGRSSTKYLSREEVDDMAIAELPLGEYEVEKTIYRKRKPIEEVRRQHYNSLQEQYYDKLAQVNPTLRDITMGDDITITETPVDKTVKGVAKEYYEYDVPARSMLIPDGGYTAPVEEDVDVTVDADGNPIDIPQRIYELEKATFPELYQHIEPTEELEEEIPVLREDVVEAEVMDDSEDDEEASSSAPVVTQQDMAIENKADLKVEPIEPVQKSISDKKVKDMAEYVAHMNDEQESSSGDEGIIDEDQDTNSPELSPMTRPYAEADSSINVDSKVEPNLAVLDEKAQMPDMLAADDDDSSKPVQDESDDEPKEFVQPIPEVDDMFEEEPKPAKKKRASAKTTTTKKTAKKPRRDNGGYDE